MEDLTLVEWDNKYSVGIPLIDQQHKELIRITNVLYEGVLKGDEASRAYFKDAVHGVVDYTKYHFSAEEKIMENIGFPGLTDHKKEHETFVKKLIADVQLFESGKQFISNVFVKFLRDWVLLHIAISDKKYGKYLIDLKKQGILKAMVAELQKENLSPTQS
jgi:hemerythrin